MRRGWFALGTIASRLYASPTVHRWRHVLAGGGLSGDGALPPHVRPPRWLLLQRAPGLGHAYTWTSRRWWWLAWWRCLAGPAFRAAMVAGLWATAEGDYYVRGWLTVRAEACLALAGALAVAAGLLGVAARA